jgi:hypothetical protein
MWVGTFDGLNLFNAQKHTFQHFKNFNSGLGSNAISAIYQDSRKNIWVGTLGGGLNLYNAKTKTFSTWDFPDAARYTIISAITEDAGGFLWVTTSNGIIRFNAQTRNFRHFSVLNGIQGPEFTLGASLTTSTGDLLFGGTSGFNIISPFKLPQNRNAPPVIFTSFQLFNKNVDISANSPLQQSISTTKTITLKHTQSVFTIEFAALNYALPELNTYAYKLEGFEKDWNYVGTQRKATYTNLDPGKYILR